MTVPGSHLPHDLKTLQYLDALNGSDLEALAALWDEASRDPELERVLAEVDGAVFMEDAVANVNDGSEHVSRSLPVPPRIGRRQRSVWVGVAGALAAACVLALLAWSRRENQLPPPGNRVVERGHQTAPRPSDEFARIPPWSEVRRIVDGAEPSTFRWPLPPTSLSLRPDSIPPDLLE
jgi:hypothetical protein